MDPYAGVLTSYASRCERVAEFGVRTGNSTRALLRGIKARGTLVSFDIDWSLCPERELESLRPDVTWTRIEKDTRDIGTMPEVEFLLIDTLHTYEQVQRELSVACVSRFIAFHDTVKFGEIGEGGAEGIGRAIKEWQLRSGWKLLESHGGHWGMDIYGAV